jgi:predicted DNA-binding ribbon-helix-helix protein
MVTKRSIGICGHKTSISLEEPFWCILKEIAKSNKMTLSSVVAHIESHRQFGNLSSAIRLFVLDHVRAKTVATDDHRDVSAVRRGFAQEPGDYSAASFVDRRLG